MNARQSIAYRYPASKPTDMQNARYVRIHRNGKVSLKSILTATSLDHEPRWHVSISVLDRNMRPKPMPAGHTKLKEVIRQQLKKLLDGVGVEAKDEFTESASAIHLTRVMTEEEVRGLSLDNERPPAPPPPANFQAHMKVFGAKLMELSKKGVRSDDAEIIAAKGANKAFPLSEEDIKYMKEHGNCD